MAVETVAKKDQPTASTSGGSVGSTTAPTPAAPTTSHQPEQKPRRSRRSGTRESGHTIPIRAPLHDQISRYAKEIQSKTGMRVTTTELLNAILALHMPKNLGEAANLLKTSRIRALEELSKL